MVVRSPLATKEEINKALGADVTSNKGGGFFGNMLENPIFGAGVGVAAMGVGLTLLRRGLITGMLMGQRFCTISLEVPSKDRSYHWVLQWINNTKKSTQHIGVETRVISHENGSQSTEFDFVPSPGRHYMWFRRNLIIVEREREKSMVDLNSGSPWETVKLTLLGRDPQVFADLLREARAQAASKQEGKMVIYMPMMTDWRPFGRPKPKRPIDSVILDDGLSRRISADVLEFQKAGKWYSQRGIPHRRGYLLHGPPGSGKTSYIQALAGELNYNICVLNLNDRGLSDDRLIHLMTELPPRSFVLLEDIDAVFTKRENTYNVTFSGLLNALDGVTSTEERIVFMTTNHIERLDPALIRPGRVDMKVYIGDSTAYQQRSLFMQFFPDITDEPSEVVFENDEDFIQANLSPTMKETPQESVVIGDNVVKSVKPRRSPDLDQHLAEEGITFASQRLANQFVAALHGCSASMAELQGLLMVHRDQPRNAIAAANELRRFKLMEQALRTTPEEIAKLETNANLFVEQNKLLGPNSGTPTPVAATVTATN